MQWRLKAAHLSGQWRTTLCVRSPHLVCVPLCWRRMLAQTPPHVAQVRPVTPATAPYADERAPRATTVHPFAIAAAKAVGLHDAIMQLPNKYKCVLQPSGAPSSHHELNNVELNLLALARKNYRVRSKHAALRHTDALWNKPASRATKAGVVPDFDALHAQWELQLERARLSLRKASVSQPSVRCRCAPAHVLQVDCTSGHQ